MYRRPLLVLPYSERPLSNLYRKNLLYVLLQQTVGIMFKTFFQCNIVLISVMEEDLRNAVKLKGTFVVPRKLLK